MVLNTGKVQIFPNNMQLWFTDWSFKHLYFWDLSTLLYSVHFHITVLHFSSFHLSSPNTSSINYITCTLVCMRHKTCSFLPLSSPSLLSLLWTHSTGYINWMYSIIGHMSVRSFSRLTVFFWIGFLCTTTINDMPCLLLKRTWKLKCQCSMNKNN